MKSAYMCFPALLAALLFGCASPPAPEKATASAPTLPAARPKIEIISAQARRNGKIDVKIRIAGLGPRRYELNVGLGYAPTGELAKHVPPGASNVYLVVQKRVIDQTATEVSVVLDPRSVSLPGTFNHQVHVNVSEHPHAQQWSPLASAQLPVARP